MGNDLHRSVFDGIQVLDLSSILAGPLTASFFAECGAYVIKVENKLTSGDATRTWKLPSEPAEQSFSAYYASANYGKQVIMLDLTTETDMTILQLLIKKSDIIISNFQKHVGEKLNLTPHQLVKSNPEAIIAQLSAYSYNDPRPGYDLVMQGETGWISMNGIDRDHLAKLPVALIDIIASHQMKEAILIAMWRKATTNLGAIVHISLYDSALSALANQATNYLIAGNIPQPIGTLHPNIAPYGDVFNDIEGNKFMLAVGSDRQFEKLWNTLTLDRNNYTIFDNNSKRVTDRSQLTYTLQHRFSQLTLTEIEGHLNKNNIPYSKIRNLAEVFDVLDSKPMLQTNIVDDKAVVCVKHTAFKIYQNENLTAKN
jgi:crotonobetainyl-CoA:carnitine CoA-transferase CaiB-like acyl-CoA transferase